MLERLWLKEELENKFLYSFIFSFIFASLSILITLYFVPFRVMSQSYTGIISVLLASLATAYPLIRYLDKREEEEENLENVNEESLLLRHLEEVIFYLMFFFGVTSAFSIFYFLTPEKFFSVQLKTILSITGGVLETSLFHTIVSNNLFVFFLTFLLSFIISSGMVFILVWNASVLGVFFGKKISLAGIFSPFKYLPQLTDLPWYGIGILIGLAISTKRIERLKISLVSLITIHILLSYNILGYMPHGILEIGAYCIAGISGFLLSRHLEDIKSEGYKEFFRLSTDCFILLGIGLFILILGGVLETL